MKCFGYLLNSTERLDINLHPKAPAKIFFHSDEFYRYNKNARKIAMLLIFSEMNKRANFEIDEKILYSELGRVAYSEPKSKIHDMKISGEKVLLEQAIVAVVSNWEFYFSNIFEKIFNDDQFINTNIDRNEKFGTILDEYRLLSDFQKLVFLNKNNFVGLNFGTYIIKNKKINFQEIDTIKKFLKKLTDIDIVKLSSNWNDIPKIIEARHIIIHRGIDSIEDNNKFNDDYRSGKKTLAEIYSKSYIEAIMKDMAGIIGEIDMKLFDQYNTKYLEEK